MSRIAVDIGGTFSDAVYLDSDARLFHGKGFTSHGSYGQGVLDAIRSLGVDVAGAEVFPHGTTVALNAIIEGKTAPTALITTRGFRDVLEIARYHRDSLYDLQEQKPVPLVPRLWRLEVDERLDWQGNVIRTLDPDEVRSRLTEIQDAGISNVAVCLLHSYRHPRHEVAIKEIAAREFPDLTVSISSDVAPQWREYERTSTAILNVSTATSVKDYLRSLEQGTSEIGMRAPILVMQSNGGVMSADDARLRPITTLMSGPVGGVIGASRVARQLSLPKLITFDVGGTSADIALIVDGEPQTTSESRIGRWQVLSHSVAIHSVGAGGGSLIRIASGGAFRVGPESAGSSPGPVCYGRGGTEPTVTDANVCLGRIDPDYFLGGTLRLDRTLARKSFAEKLLPQLQVSIEEAADGAIKVINTVMARAIREDVVARGYDPAEFGLLSFGGGGGLHAALVAQELGMRRVVVPSLPGHFSAIGILQADMRHDLTAMMLVRTGNLRLSDLNAQVAALRDEGGRKLAAAAVAEDAMDFQYHVEMRYAGQDDTLSVPVAAPLEDIESIEKTFSTLHEQTFGYDLPNEMELVTLRVTAIGRVSQSSPTARQHAAPDRAPEPSRIRKVYFGDAGRFVDCPFFDRYALPVGQAVIGPAVIEEDASTVLVPHGWAAAAEPHGNLILNRRKA